MCFPFQKQCPPGFMRVLNSCYSVILEQYDWTESMAVCNEAGGYLAAITSQTEHDAVAEAVYPIAKQGIWLGGYYDGTLASWKWINGEAWNYSNFDAYALARIPTGNSVLVMSHINHNLNREWRFSDKDCCSKITVCETNFV